MEVYFLRLHNLLCRMVQVMFKSELKKMLSAPILYASIAIGLVSCLLGLVTYFDSVYYIKAVGELDSISAYDAWQDCLALGSSVYRVILPLLIVPFLDSYFNERASGYSVFILTRKTYLRYYLAKWFVGIISAALVVLCVLGCTLLICLLLFPENVPKAENCPFNYEWAVRLFTTYPLKYILLLIALNVYFAVIYYSFGFALSCFAKNKYIVLLTPFFIYLAQLLVWQMFNIPALSPLVFIAHYEVNWLTVDSMVYAGIGELLLALILLFVGYKKNENYV